MLQYHRIVVDSLTLPEIWMLVGSFGSPLLRLLVARGSGGTTVAGGFNRTESVSRGSEGRRSEADCSFRRTGLQNQQSTVVGSDEIGVVSLCN